MAIRIIVSLAFLFMLSETALATASPQIVLGWAGGGVGTSATLPVRLTNVNGGSIVSITIEIGYDTDVLENPSVAIGPAASEAGKSVNSSIISPGVYRIEIAGPDNAQIGEGIVANVTYDIASTATQGPTLLTNSPSSADPNGDPVDIGGLNGLVVVTPASVCSKTYYHLDISGDYTFGFIDYGKSVCTNSTGRLWIKDLYAEGYMEPWQGFYAILGHGPYSPLKYLPPLLGQTWKHTGNEYHNGKEYSFESLSTVTSVSESVSVTAGTFDNCAKVEEMVTYPDGSMDSMKFGRWFAPGVGPVKFVVTTTSGDEIVPPRELISYQNTKLNANDYFPLGLGSTWTFATDSGNTTTWVSSRVLTVTLVGPNGGEIIPAGSNYAITWLAPPKASKFKLFYSMDNGATWIRMHAVPYVTGDNYEWTVPTPSRDKKECLVKVSGFNDSGRQVGQDKSDEPFSIGVVRLASPKPKDVLESSKPYSITWATNTTKAPASSTNLYYTVDGGSLWRQIPVTLTGNPGMFEWTAPKVQSKRTKCKVKVVMKDFLGNVVGRGESTGYFTIQPVATP